MSRREDIIVEMLKRYTEAQEEALTGSPGDGSHVPLMPTTWNRSYRELERCLKLMRDARSKQYWHVCERYIRAEILTLTVPFSKAKKGPLPKLPPHTELVAGAKFSGEAMAAVRVRRWKPEVREEKVRNGIDYLSGTFRGEPFLPAEFQEAA